jgi:nicotinamidase-related amidase
MIAMPALDLRVRCYQDSTPLDVSCREEHFARREVVMRLPVRQTAFLLIDMWNDHFIESWIEPAREVTVEAAVPALAAAREAGLTIVHAPCPEVAAQYTQLQRHAPPAKAAEPDWPPAGFRRREGAYAAHRGQRDQPPGTWSHCSKVEQMHEFSASNADSLAACQAARG